MITRQAILRAIDILKQDPALTEPTIKMLRYLDCHVSTLEPAVLLSHFEKYSHDNNECYGILDTIYKVAEDEARRAHGLSSLVPQAMPENNVNRLNLHTLPYMILKENILPLLTPKEISALAMVSNEKGLQAAIRDFKKSPRYQQLPAPRLYALSPTVNEVELPSNRSILKMSPLPSGGFMALMSTRELTIWQRYFEQEHQRYVYAITHSIYPFGRHFASFLKELPIVLSDGTLLFWNELGVIVKFYFKAADVFKGDYSQGSYQQEEEDTINLSSFFEFDDEFVTHVAALADGRLLVATTREHLLGNLRLSLYQLDAKVESGVRLCEKLPSSETHGLVLSGVIVLPDGGFLTSFANKPTKYWGWDKIIERFACIQTLTNKHDTYDYYRYIARLPNGDLVATDVISDSNVHIWRESPGSKKYSYLQKVLANSTPFLAHLWGHDPSLTIFPDGSFSKKAIGKRNIWSWDKHRKSYMLVHRQPLQVKDPGQGPSPSSIALSNGSLIECTDKGFACLQFPELFNRGLRQQIHQQEEHQEEPRYPTDEYKRTAPLLPFFKPNFLHFYLAMVLVVGLGGIVLPLFFGITAFMSIVAGAALSFVALIPYNRFRSALDNLIHERKQPKAIISFMAIAIGLVAGAGIALVLAPFLIPWLGVLNHLLLLGVFASSLIGIVAGDVYTRLTNRYKASAGIAIGMSIGAGAFLALTLVVGCASLFISLPAIPSVVAVASLFVLSAVCVTAITSLAAKMIMRGYYRLRYGHSNADGYAFNQGECSPIDAVQASLFEVKPAQVKALRQACLVGIQAANKVDDSIEAFLDGPRAAAVNSMKDIYFSLISAKNDKDKRQCQALIGSSCYVRRSERDFFSQELGRYPWGKIGNDPGLRKNYHQSALALAFFKMPTHDEEAFKASLKPFLRV